MKHLATLLILIVLIIFAPKWWFILIILGLGLIAFISQGIIDSVKDFFEERKQKRERIKQEEWEREYYDNYDGYDY